jgi:hypothetical protein
MELAPLLLAAVVLLGRVRDLGVRDGTVKILGDVTR